MEPPTQQGGQHEPQQPVTPEPPQAPATAPLNNANNVDAERQQSSESTRQHSDVNSERPTENVGEVATQKERRERIKFIVDIVGVGLNFFLAILTFFMLKAARDAVVETQKSTEQSIEANRIGLESLKETRNAFRLANAADRRDSMQAVQNDILDSLRFNRDNRLAAAQIENIGLAQRTFEVQNSAILGVTNIVLGKTPTSDTTYIAFYIANLGTYPANILRMNTSTVYSYSPLTERMIIDELIRRTPEPDGRFALIKEAPIMERIPIIENLPPGQTRYIVGLIIYENMATRKLNYYAFEFFMRDRSGGHSVLINHNAPLTKEMAKIVALSR